MHHWQTNTGAFLQLVHGYCLPLGMKDSHYVLFLYLKGFDLGSYSGWQPLFLYRDGFTWCKILKYSLCLRKCGMTTYSWSTTHTTMTILCPALGGLGKPNGQPTVFQNGLKWHLENFYWCLLPLVSNYELVLFYFSSYYTKKVILLDEVSFTSHSIVHVPRRRQGLGRSLCYS